ncbi:MAG: hypothetical protein FWH53_07380 [Leptospirales bacterium]|nr:hypothetical protein [Leptospirales bacterium]
MKKLFLTLTAISISIIITHKAYAVDVTVGATTWFAMSEQYYTQSGGFFIKDLLVKSDPAFLYGPTLAMRFSNDFNLTFVFLYGTFDTTKDKGNNFKQKSQYQRIDSDLALNYRLSDYFKVFGGMKFLTYDITPTKSDNGTFTIISIDPHISYGTGLGLSATVPIVGDLFVLGTISGLYLWGADKVKVEELISGASTNNYRNLSNSYNEYGINTTLSFAYYIAHYSTVISLGGRFQYIIADYNDNVICLDSIKFTIYGVTLTATYTFSL